jgi:hypothetical protein
VGAKAKQDRALVGTPLIAAARGRARGRPTYSADQIETGRKTMNTTETALEKLEKFLEAEFETYCAKAGPDASAEGFEKRVTPILMADAELIEAATRRVVDDPELLRAALTEIVDRANLEAKVVANSDETLMQFLQSRS